MYNRERDARYREVNRKTIYDHHDRVRKLKSIKSGVKIICEYENEAKKIK